MEKLISTILIFSILLSVSITSFAISAEDAAKDLGNYGIINGFPDGTLRLENNVTRAEAAKMAITAYNSGTLKYLKYDYYEDAKPVFIDMTRDHWAYYYVERCNSHGWVKGFPDLTFKPEDNITCEQAIKIVVCALRYDSYKKQELNNEEELKYPDDYIAIAKEYGITDGLSFELGQNATRGFLATLISKSIDIPLVEVYIIDESKVPNILWKKFGFKIMNGTGGNELKTYRHELEKNKK